MTILSTFALFWGGLYLENILPAAAGVRKPFYFCLTKSWWCGAGKSKNEHSLENQVDEEAKSELNDAFEEVPESLKRKEEDGDFLNIEHLNKKFGEFVAIDDLNVKMYGG